MSGSKTKKCSTFLGDAGLLPALVTASWQDTSLFLTRGLAMVPRLPSYESFPWQFELSKHWGTFRHMLHSVRSIRQTRSVLKTVFSALRTTLRSSELSMCSLRMFKLKPESCARAAGQSFKKKHQMSKVPRFWPNLTKGILIQCHQLASQFLRSLCWETELKVRAKAKVWSRKQVQGDQRIEKTWKYNTNPGSPVEGKIWFKLSSLSTVWLPDCSDVAPGTWFVHLSTTAILEPKTRKYRWYRLGPGKEWRRHTARHGPNESKWYDIKWHTQTRPTECKWRSRKTTTCCVNRKFEALTSLTIDPFEPYRSIQ